MKNFIDLTEFKRSEIEHILSRAEKLKSDRQHGSRMQPLLNKSVVLYFEKPSLRTRVSFEIGVKELGGTTVYLDQSMVGMGKRESPKDIARTLNQYVDAMVCRIFDHSQLYELSEWADFSIINALTDFSHPCQILADVLTLREHQFWKDDLTLTWVGDPNNVLQSWIELAMIYPITIQISCPELPSFYDQFFHHKKLKDRFWWIKDPKKAVVQTDLIYADTWISMGQEEQAKEKKALYEGYTINSDLLKNAPSHVQVLHCLPAKRGEEIDDQVLETFAPIIFSQAENRLHAQKSILWGVVSPTWHEVNEVLVETAVWL